MLNTRVCVVGFSYGMRNAGEPGLSNRALIVSFISRYQELAFNATLVLQHELADSIPKEFEHQMRPSYVVTHHREHGGYLDSGEVAQQAARFAKSRGCNTIYVLAYPFLHRPLCTWYIRTLTSRNAEVYTLKTGWIPSDPQSLQWWTRNPFYLPLYVAQKTLSTLRGK